MADKTTNSNSIIKISEDGMADFTSEKILKTLENFNSDVIDYLYDGVEPQSQNLFYGGFFQEAGDGSGSFDHKPLFNASFRIRSITLPAPSMEIEQNEITRSPTFKNVNFSNELSIDWFEDVYHSVTKYHLDWFNRWYNRYYDVLRCGIKGKFRKLYIVAYHYKNSLDIEHPLQVPKIEPIMTFIIGGMIPKAIPQIKWDYSAPQNDAPISITYNCGKIQWAYNRAFKGNDSLWKTDGSAVGNEENIINVNGFNDEYGDDNNSNGENLRITRGVTHYQPGEGIL